MRKCTRALSLCLMLALMLSLGMPAAFADDAHEAAPSVGAVEKLPEEDAPKAEVPAEQEKQTETETAVKPEEPAASSEPAKEVQADATKTVSGFAEPSGKGAKICIHNWQTESNTEATCTEYGKLHQKCSKCGETRTIPDLTAVPKLHDYSILVETKREATCTLVGWGVYKCVRCDHTLEKSIPMKDHVFNANNVIPGFGLIDDNNHTVKCENCSFTWTVAHNKVTVSEKPATCTEDGYSAGTYCADGCGYDTRTVYKADGHKSVPIPGKAATCTEDGLTEGAKCSVCQEILVPQEKIPASHKWGEWTVTDPTCTKNGEKTRTCYVCRQTETETILTEGHKKEPIPGKAATCTEDGLTEGTKCSVCQEIIVPQEKIPAGHKLETITGKAATCTEDGLTDGKKCSVCQEIIVPQEKIPAGHKLETITGKAATCTEDGLTDGKKCSVCQEIIVPQEKIPADGHKLETIPGKAATCTEDGLTDGKKCSVCQEILVPQEKIAASHKWGDWTVTRAATCTRDGVKTRSCSVCKASETRPIAATGHTEEAIPDQKATCTEPGSVGGKRCSVCKAVLEEPEVVPATGHDWGLWADAKDGWHHVRFCANDPSHKQYEHHKMGDWVTVKHNTETTDGYRERWCQVPDCDYHEVQVIRAGSPKTGDSSNILLYAGLCLISACGAVGLAVCAKRRREQ